MGLPTWQKILAPTHFLGNWLNNTEEAFLQICNYFSVEAEHFYWEYLLKVSKYNQRKLPIINTICLEESIFSNPLKPISDTGSDWSPLSDNKQFCTEISRGWVIFW